MSLAYPIARNLEDAMLPGVPTARTQRCAEALSPGYRIDGLETGWLHLTEDEARALFAGLGADGPAGHIQHYEDTSGHVVIAVSWWRLADPASPPRLASPPPASSAPGASSPKPTADHTDDLYFRRGRNKSRRRKPVNTNQLDLFDPPKA